MDTAHYKKLLQDKERELAAEISRLKTEGREARSAEVEDPIDEVTSTEGQAEAFGASAIEWGILEQVRDALRRIEQGTYGKCIDCGRPIEPARLEAVPRTPYCKADQELHDKEGGE